MPRAGWPRVGAESRPRVDAMSIVTFGKRLALGVARALTSIFFCPLPPRFDAPSAPTPPPAMTPSPYGVTEAGAYTVLAMVLFTFMVISFFASDYSNSVVSASQSLTSSPTSFCFKCYVYLRDVIRLPIPPSASSASHSTGGGALLSSSSDFFLAARGSSNASTIALSFFAGGMGAWVLYGTTEMGANPKLAWLGIIGYSGGSAVVGALLALLGPGVKEVRKR